MPPLDSEAWAHVAKNPIASGLARPLREVALGECETPMPVLTDELYASFRQTGRRLDFEQVYFERRRRLARAAITILLSSPDDPARAALVPSLVRKFTSIFEEVSWALPAHVNWHNGDLSGKEPMQIDLFCAETANLMAEMLDYFGAVLPPALQERVRERLRTHVFENYSNRFEDFHWPKVTHNWNAVCHQGVLGSALSQCADVDQVARMLLLAAKSLPLFLGGFARDGGCTEGIGYWSYGFGWFTLLNEQLETRTGGELSLFEGDDHVRKIAQFGPRMALFGRKLVNFSDNGAEGDLSPTLLTYLGRRLKEPDCLRTAERSYHSLVQKGIETKAERCDLLSLGRMLLRCPTEVSSESKAVVEDCFLPDLAVLVAHGVDRRGHVWDFAAKAGHNDEHHNHNDCGGYLLNVDGVRLVAEIGSPEYDVDFFGPKRYENLAARSLGHSLPVINGFEQSAGVKFAARVVSHRIGGDVSEFQVEAGACYPAEAGCTKFLRTFRLDKTAGKLTVTDVYELSPPTSLESALVAIYPIVIFRDRAVIQAGQVDLVVRPRAGTKLDRVEVHSYKSHSGQEASIYRLVVSPVGMAAGIEVGVDLALS